MKMVTTVTVLYILLSRHSKIGGTFITMPVKGVGDAFHEYYKGLVTE
jgi:hypothetical protein